MGYHTSTAVAFLLTVFNVRLGYWIHNPKRKDWRPNGPLWGQRYFIAELFGMADDASKYVYLSDGGHFENLAVYELLRRKCRYIICVDGEQDENMKFEGLAALIRRARSDMGIEIRIETADIEERSGEGWSKAHCAVGLIDYPGEEPDGMLLYLKLSVTGDEPVDVLHYRKVNAAFPHQTTGDQFFDEPQFESYRRLGFHVAEHAFRSVWKENEKKEEKDKTNIKTIFDKLRVTWHGLPRTAANNFTKLTKAFDELMRELGSGEHLEPLQSQLKRVKPATMADMQSLTPPQARACFQFAQRLIQLMENCYFDLDLESNIEAPALEGWKELFLDWSQSTLVQETWKASRHIYSGPFNNFYDRVLTKS